MAKTITLRIVNWTSSLALDTVDRGALWVDRLNRKIADTLLRAFGS